MKIYIIWALLTLISGILPGYMLYFGKKLFDEIPSENAFYAFKSKIAKENEEIWVYANTKCGEIWINIGEKMLPVSILTMIFSFGQNLNALLVFFSVVLIAEIIFFVYSFVLVNKKIKENFSMQKKEK